MRNTAKAQRRRFLTVSNPFDQFDGTTKTANPFDQFDQMNAPENDAGKRYGVEQLITGDRPQPITPNNRSRELPAQMQIEVNKMAEDVAGHTSPLGALSNNLIGGMGGDYFNAAMNSLIPLGPARFGQFKDNLEMGRQINDTVAADHPIASGVGRVTGNVAGISKLGKLGLTATKAVPAGLTGAKGLAATTAAVGVDGAGLMAADALISGEDVAAKAKQGGAISAAANVVLRGTGSAASNFVTRFRAKTPSTAQIQNSAKEAYKKAESYGAEFSPNQVQGLVDDIDAIVPRGGLGGVDAVSHPSAHRAVKKITEHPKNQGATLSELDAFRKNLTPSPLNKSDTRLTAKIRKRVDDFTAKVPAKTAKGTPQEANAALLGARKLHRTAEQAKAIDALVKRLKGSSAWTKGKKDEAITNLLRSIVNSPKKSAQFNKQDIIDMRKIVDGTPVKNLARRATRLNPLENQLALGAGGASLVTGTAPIVGSLNVAGLASRLGVNTSSRRGLAQIVRQIKQRGGPDIKPSELEKALKDPETAAAIAKALGIQE